MTNIINCGKRNITEILIWNANKDFIVSHNLEKLEVLISSEYMVIVNIEYWSAWSNLNRRKVGCNCDLELRFDLIDDKTIDFVSEKLNEIIASIWNDKPEDDKLLFIFASELAQKVEVMLRNCQE